MKPRWTIKSAQWLQGSAFLTCGCRWLWMRRDRNGLHSVVGCLGHHIWTKRVKSFEVIP